MKSLEQLRTAATLKRLKDDGLSNSDIVQMVKADGWDAVKGLVGK